MSYEGFKFFKNLQLIFYAIISGADLFSMTKCNLMKEFYFDRYYTSSTINYKALVSLNPRMKLIVDLM